jgi:hypothetical protein
MPRGPRLNEADLRSITSAIPWQQAERDVAAGHLVERRVYRNGAIHARWSAELESDQSILATVGGELEAECTCAAFAEGRDCEHVLALALAWSRDPNSFVAMPQTYTVGDFSDEFVISGPDEFDALADVIDPNDPLEDGQLAAASQTEGVPATPKVLLASAGQRLSATIRTALPDLTEDYRLALQNLNLNQLREVAERRGIAVNGNRRAPMLAAVAAALAGPEAVARAWSGLSPVAGLVTAILPFAQTGMGVHKAHLSQALNALEPAAAKKLPAALQELLDAGLLFQNEWGYYVWPTRLILYWPPDPAFVRPLTKAAHLRVVPARGPLDFGELAIRLLLVLKGRPLPAQPPAAPHPLRKRLPGLLGQWPYVPDELDSLAQHNSPQSGFYSARFTVPPAPPLLAAGALAGLARDLESPPETIDFAVRLLDRLGLLERIPDGMLAARETVFLEFVGQHPVQTVMPLYNVWLQMADWTELDLALAREPDLRLARQANVSYGLSYASLTGSLASARTGLLQYLRRAPADTWIDLPAFVARARSLNSGYALWNMAPGLALELNGRGLSATRSTDWPEIFGRWVESILAGPLYWFGAVDLGYDQGRLAAFRFTPLGALLMMQSTSFTAPEATAEAGQSLVFEPDGTLQLHLASADPQLLALLVTLGEVRVGRAGKFIGRISAAGAARAFEGGWDAERVLSTLERAGGAVPRALARQLREWWRRFGEVQLYRGLALIELADDFALNELLANTALSRYLLYRFSPRLVAVRPEGLEALRAELVDKGYTPTVAG